MPAGDDNLVQTLVQMRLDPSIEDFSCGCVADATQQDGQYVVVNSADLKKRGGIHEPYPLRLNKPTESRALQN